VEGLQARPVRQRVLCGLVAAIAIVGGILAFGGPAQAHSGDTIQSLWASVPPAVDGAMSSGEWSAAASVDLGAIPGNQLPAFLLIMNNDSFLWVAYDAVGDTTVTTNDSASFSLDTGHDGAATDGGEDEFYLGDFTAHIVWRGGGYTWEDMPFDPGLPDHAGLAGVRGFGPSDLGGADHRFYEFQIPLVLIGASPGDTLGLFGGSQPAPGVTDYSGYAYSTWPSYVTSPIPLAQYGNLDLAVPPGPIGVVLSPSSATTNGAPGQNVSYNQMWGRIVQAYHQVRAGMNSGDSSALRAAQSDLTALASAAEQFGWEGYFIELLALRALASFSLGDAGHAMRDLDQALGLAEQDRRVLLFVSKGKAMADLLTEAIRQGIQRRPFAQKLLDRFPEEEAPRKEYGHPDLVEPLSEREVEVLTRMAEGLTYHDIAERLFISVNTVRYHVKGLYGKLGVSSRADAIARARDLNLI